MIKGDKCCCVLYFKEVLNFIMYKWKSVLEIGRKYLNVFYYNVYFNFMQICKIVKIESKRNKNFDIKMR